MEGETASETEKSSKTEKIKLPNRRKGLFPRASAVFHCINFGVAMFPCLCGFFPVKEKIHLKLYFNHNLFILTTTHLI